MTRNAIVRFHLASGDDDQALRTLQLTSDKAVLIGRSSKDPSKKMLSLPTNLNIKNSVISRLHGKITYQPSSLDDEWAIHVEDSYSSHGTFLNGEPLTPGKPIPVCTGDQITLGISISRSDGCKFSLHNWQSISADTSLTGTHLPPTYEMEIETEDDDFSSVYSLSHIEHPSHVGRSYSMPNFQDDPDYDDYDHEDNAENEEAEAMLESIYDDSIDAEGEEERYNSDYDLEFYKPLKTAGYEPEWKEEEDDDTEVIQGDTVVKNEDTAPTSAQPVSSSLIMPVSKDLQTPPTPEEDTTAPSTSSRINAYWDPVLDTALEALEATKIPASSPRVLQIKDLLSSAPVPNRKRKFDYESEEEEEEVESDIHNSTSSQDAVVPETMELSTMIPPKQELEITDVTLVEEEEAEQLAQLLKEPIEGPTVKSMASNHRHKRSRLASVAYSVGLIVAGSVGTLAGLAALPEGYFA